MAIETEAKEVVIEKFQHHPGDTGSTEVQVALLTDCPYADDPLSDRREITLPVEGAFGEAAPGVAGDEVLALDFLSHDRLYLHAARARVIHE